MFPRQPASLVSPPLRLDGLGPDSPSGAHRFWHHPVVRAVLLLVLVVAGMLLGRAIALLGGWHEAWVVVGTVTGAVIGYLVLAIGVEGRRPPIELDPRRLLGLLWGLLLGTLLFSLCFGILLLLGAYRITGIDTAGPWLVPSLVLGLQAGVVEEILARTGLHRLLEQGLGTWVTAIASGAVFGWMHLANPNGGPVGSMAIMLGAGIGFGLLYSLSRSLWLVIGVHASWNLTQGMLFGAVVSGADAPSPGLLVSESIGPDALTGGSFGPEASPVTVAVMLAWTVGLAVLLVRRGLVVRPVWVRRRGASPGSPMVAGGKGTDANHWAFDPGLDLEWTDGRDRGAAPRRRAD